MLTRPAVVVGAVLSIVAAILLPEVVGPILALGGLGIFVFGVLFGWPLSRGLSAVAGVLLLIVGGIITPPSPEMLAERQARAEARESERAVREAEDIAEREAADRRERIEREQAVTRDGNMEFVSRDTWWDGAWPLTIDNGILTCLSPAQAVYIVEEDGRAWALNGMASSRAGRHGAESEIRPIWVDDPDIPGAKVYIGRMIDRGLALCDGSETSPALTGLSPEPPPCPITGDVPSDLWPTLCELAESAHGGEAPVNGLTVMMAPEHADVAHAIRAGTVEAENMMLELLAAWMRTRGVRVAQVDIYFDRAHLATAETHAWSDPSVTFH